jgi:hypothetical protein
MTPITNVHLKEQKRYEPLFRIVNGNPFYVIDDKEIPFIFDKQPTPLKIVSKGKHYKGSNIDHTKDWLND